MWNYSNLVILSGSSGPNIPLFVVLVVFAALCLIGVVIIAIYLVRSGKKEKKINNDAWLLALGGKENISSIKGVGSRLSVVLNDKEKIDRHLILILSQGILKMSYSF